MVKTIKITLLLTLITFFISIPNTSKAKDCSHLVKLHEKLMCKAGSDVYDSDASTTFQKTEKVKKEKKVKKERGGEDVNTLEKLMKKLKLKK